MFYENPRHLVTVIPKTLGTPVIVAGRHVFGNAPDAEECSFRGRKERIPDRTYPYL